jgi:hypothetical protein
MIVIQFKRDSDAKVRAAIEARGPKFVSALTAESNATMADLLARVQQKLSGEVLQTRRGGGLLGTARMNPTKRVGALLIGSVQAGGGPAAAYAQVQERGGRGPYEIYPKNKLALAFYPTGSEGLSEALRTAMPGQGKTGRLAGLQLRRDIRAARRAPVTERSSRKLKNLYGDFASLGGVVVRHVTHPPLPERSFMRSTLEEMRREIVSRIYRAAARAIEP